MTITNSIEDLSPEVGTMGSNLRFTFQLQGVTSGVLSTVIAVEMFQTGAKWRQVPLFDNVLIDGVNDCGFFTEDAKHGPDHTHDTCDVNNCPEPTSMFAIGLACFAAGGRFARKRRSQQAT